MAVVGPHPQWTDWGDVVPLSFKDPHPRLQDYRICLLISQPATVVTSFVPFLFIRPAPPSLPASPSLSLCFPPDSQSHLPGQGDPSTLFQSLSTVPLTTMAGVSRQQWEDLAFSSSSITKHMWPWALSHRSEACSPPRWLTGFH